jgi:toxin ParE1/3/4
VKRVSLSHEAVGELAEAAAWYETRRDGLAIRFLQDIDQTRVAIQSPRLASTPDDLEIRRALLPRFPYALIFLELQTEVRVLAVAHVKRDPDYWLNRLKPT